MAQSKPTLARVVPTQARSGQHRDNIGQDRAKVEPTWAEPCGLTTCGTARPAFAGVRPASAKFGQARPRPSSGQHRRTSDKVGKHTRRPAQMCPGSHCPSATEGVLPRGLGHEVADALPPGPRPLSSVPPPATQPRCALCVPFCQNADVPAEGGNKGHALGARPHSALTAGAGRAHTVGTRTPGARSRGTHS